MPSTGFTRASPIYQSPRPTLPPLHTLGLPTLEPKLPPYNSSYISRKLSSSSSSTYSTESWERTPSPTPSSASSSSSSSSTSSASGGFRLIPSTMSEATALIVVHPSPPQSPSPSPTTTNPSKAFLVIGSSIEPYKRHHAHRGMGGVRVHPYRIMPRRAGSGSSEDRGSVRVGPKVNGLGLGRPQRQQL